MPTAKIEIHDCLDYKTRLRYEAELKQAGAEVVDHKIDFRTNTATFYLRFRMPDGYTRETFIEKLRVSSIWHLTSLANMV